MFSAISCFVHKTVSRFVQILMWFSHNFCATVDVLSLLCCKRYCSDLLASPTTDQQDRRKDGETVGQNEQRESLIVSRNDAAAIIVSVLADKRAHIGLFYLPLLLPIHTRGHVPATHSQP